MWGIGMSMRWENITAALRAVVFKRPVSQVRNDERQACTVMEEGRRAGEGENPDLSARRMREELVRARNREAVLSRFVDTLSARDAKALRKVLGDLDRKRE